MILESPHYGISLRRLTRRPHYAWPRCVARELVDDAGNHITADKYTWCNRPAKWGWGEQHLCPLHAAQLVERRRVDGITPNGRWGGCIVHIDCDHSIDDPEWESKYTRRRSEPDGSVPL